MVSQLPVEPFRSLGDLAKIFGNSTRLQMLHLLSAGEACVCHLTAILGLRQANVSQHLMILRDAHLVEDRRDGMMVYYRLTGARIPEMIALLHTLISESAATTPLPAVPGSPVKGCPCPKCAIEQTRPDR